jgi:hypothetical protein
MKDGSTWIEEDPYLFDSCAARFIDEAMTEEGENCRFQVINGTIWLVATRSIRRYEQLLTRYGHQYWCNAKWPLSLLLTMHAKYCPTLHQAQESEWNMAIRQRKDLNRLERCHSTTSILKKHVAPPPPPHPKPRGPALVTLNKRRRAAQKVHRRAVQLGKIPSRRPVPQPEHPSTETLPFLPQTWSHTFPPGPSGTDIPSQRTVCRFMSWAIQGRLGTTGNSINSGIREFLTHVAELMIRHSVHIMWLTDARFTEGMFDIYLPTLTQLLPNCRVYQFPTYYIKTGSRCDAFNRMGGAVAIVTHEWHGYVVKHLPDPTGSGLINALDINIGPYSLRSICPYTSFLAPRLKDRRLSSLAWRITLEDQSVQSGLEGSTHSCTSTPTHNDWSAQRVSRTA